MAALILGLILGGLKLADIGPFAGMSWWWVIACFGAAAVWWAIADSTGMTQRRAIEKMEERKSKRRERDMEALGLNTRRERRLQSIKEAKRRALSADERQALSPDTHETRRKE